MSNLLASIEDLQHNPEQLAAFEAEGHCVVLAPPGSGKTKLLTTRMAYDLEHRIPRPQGAACITLTNAAAGELQQRCHGLAVQQRSTLFIGTVHGFAMGCIVFPFARLLGRPELLEISIATDTQKDGALREAIGEVFPYGDTRWVESTVTFNRKRLATEAQWAQSGEHIVEVRRRYEAKLAERGLADFEGVIAVAVDFVERFPLVRKALVARYPRFYVDEYQDLAPGLDRLVKALCFDAETKATLFAVGDPDQAVFGWTGTRPELLDELACRRDDGVQPVYLQRNYRNSAEILRVANILMRVGKPQMIGQRAGGAVQLRHCPGGQMDQCRQIAAEVVRYQSAGIPLDEILIICPWKQHCEQVARYLRSQGIAAFVRGSEYELTEITTLIEACAAWAAHGRESSGYRLFLLLRRWRIALGQGWDRTAATDLTTLLLEATMAPATSASSFLHAIAGLGLADSLKTSGRLDDLRALSEMEEALTSGPLAEISVAQLAERARLTDRVEVTTMTSSKGLEFDIVLLFGADEKWIPHFSSATKPDELKEDRRKFYVSLTRARYEVQIFYSGFVVWRSGQADHAGPSRFLREAGLLGSN